MQPCGFHKALRLLNAADYKSVFDDASLKVSSRQVLFLARPNGRKQPRLGLVVAKKNAKYATQRNRIKRIARENFRLRQHQLAGIDTIVLARHGLDQLDNAEIHALFDQLWHQLQKKAAKLQQQNNTKP